MLKPHRPSTLLLSPLFIVLLLGCGKIHCRQSDSSAAGANAHAADMLAATAPGYKTPDGMLQECLGRLVFDLSGPVEWPTFYVASNTLSYSSGFSKTVDPQGGLMKVGTVKVNVFGPLNAGVTASLENRVPSGKIRNFQAYIAEAQEELRTLAKLPRPDASELSRIADLNANVARWQSTIVELKKKFSDVKLGIADSVGYSTTEHLANNKATTYSVMGAHLQRNKYMYLFESIAELKPGFTEEQHRAQFVKLLAAFRPRAVNDVPKEPGICIPHGFIADDGKTAVEINQSLRWRDAPGVLYSIHTGTVEKGQAKASVVTAVATAVTGKFGSDAEAEIKPFVTERIGPRVAAIGGLKASQGGVALKVTGASGPAYETYNVFTGYEGVEGVAALPYILIEMSTRTMEQAKELKQNPPPFKQSMARLDILLKSTRLRPTTAAGAAR